MPWLNPVVTTGSSSDSGPITTGARSSAAIWCCSTGSREVRVQSLARQPAPSLPADARGPQAWPAVAHTVKRTEPGYAAIRQWHGFGTVGFTDRQEALGLSPRPDDLPRVTMNAPLKQEFERGLEVRR
jgi:hypothetical protein